MYFKQYYDKKIGLLTGLLLATHLLFAQNNAFMHQTIRLSRTSGTVLEFLDDLSKNYSLSFSYNTDIIPPDKFSAHKNEWQLDDFLSRLLGKANIKFAYVNQQIILKKHHNPKMTISGTITNKADGEQLIGATVYIKELNTGAVTNAYGFYSITVPPGTYTLVYSYIGCRQKKQEIKPGQTYLRNIALRSGIENLNEVVVSAKQTDDEDIEGAKTNQMSAHSMKIDQIKGTPMLGGEADVLKNIQFLPGVQNGSEGTASFGVRGGGYDQNLILLDDAPVYNVSHALGFFSIFNVDAVKDVHVYKGGIPAKFGGRLSSVVDLRMKEGNNQKFSLSGGIGLGSSRLTAEGPLGNKVSYMLSGRYGYLGHSANLMATYIRNIISGTQTFNTNNEIDFYDFNAKINAKLNKNNKIYLSAFAGNDHFYNELALENNTLDWGNQTATFRWNHIFTPRLFGNLTLTYGNFNYNNQVRDNTQGLKWYANLQQQSARFDFDYFAAPQNTYNFGASLTNHRFIPGKAEPLPGSSFINPVALDTRHAIETATYISNTQQWGKLSVTYGLRFSSFHNVGSGIQYIYDNNGQLQEEKKYNRGEIMQSYYGLAPRTSFRYLLSNSSSLKASYNRTYQYLHQVSNTSIGLPTDIWLPADNNIKPRFADQVALGYVKELKDGRYQLSAETYYKWFSQVIDYKDNADVFLNPNIETQIGVGWGRAYGLELMLEKKKGRLTGWLSYTLSKTEQKINQVNHNQIYSPRHDRRHNVSLVLAYNLGKRWQIAANYAYMTGAGITAVRGVYGLPLFQGGNMITYYSSRNGFKLPDFHQLDISIKLKSNRKKRWQGEWVLGVTNVYNRKNPATYFFNGILGNRGLSRLYLFGIMPTLNYNFKF